MSNKLKKTEAYRSNSYLKKLNLLDLSERHSAITLFFITTNTMLPIMQFIFSGTNVF